MSHQILRERQLRNIRCYLQDNHPQDLNLESEKNLFRWVTFLPTHVEYKIGSSSIPWDKRALQRFCRKKLGKHWKLDEREFFTPPVI